MDSNIIRIFESSIPMNSSYNLTLGTYDLVSTYAVHLAESFDDEIVSAVKSWMMESRIHKMAVLNKKALSEMMLNYDNPDYIKIIRCEKCQSWRPMHDDMGVCCKAGVMRDKDYYCRDGSE